MFKRQAILLSAVALLVACGQAAPAPKPANSPAAPPDPPPAHQSEEKPKLPPNHAGHTQTPGAKSFKLTFDTPPAWSQAPENLVRKPWKLGLINAEVSGLVLMDFEVNAKMTAVEHVGRIIGVMCSGQGWSCTPSKLLADGTGATFTFATEKTKGKIAVRDLAGPARCQVQLYGRWAKADDAQAAKDFDTMVKTTQVE